MDQGLLIGRLVFGTWMAGHGAQKLFGWFGGYGLDGTGGFFEQLGFHPGRTFAAAAGLSELLGGLLLALGLLGPLGPMFIIGPMVVAIVAVHWHNGAFAAANGIELPLLFAAFAVTAALTGPGRYSLDAAAGLSGLWTPALGWTAIAAGIIGGVVNLVLRRTPVAVRA